MVLSLWEQGLAGHLLLWVSVCGTTVQKNLRGFRVPSEWKCLFSSHLVNLQSHVSLAFSSTEKNKKSRPCSKASIVQFSQERDGCKMGQIFLETMGWWAWEGRWHVTMEISGFLRWSENGAIAGFCSGFVFPGVAVCYLENARDQVRFTPVSMQMFRWSLSIRLWGIHLSWSRLVNVPILENLSSNVFLILGWIGDLIFLFLTRSTWCSQW